MGGLVGPLIENSINFFLFILNPSLINVFIRIQEAILCLLFNLHWEFISQNGRRTFPSRNNFYEQWVLFLWENTMHLCSKCILINMVASNTQKVLKLSQKNLYKWHIRHIIIQSHELFVEQFTMKFIFFLKNSIKLINSLIDSIS